MKTRNLFFLIALGVFTSVLVMADSIDDFTSALNDAWSHTNDTQVLQVINDRLASNTNDLLGLSSKMYYFVFAEGNLTNARATADAFMGVINSGTNADLIAYAQGMRDEVYGISLDESGPYTTDQKAQLRQPAASFPFIEKCVAVARWLN